MSAGAQVNWFDANRPKGGDWFSANAPRLITPDTLQSFIVRRSQGQLSPEEDAELVRFIGDPANKQAVESVKAGMSGEGRQGAAARFLNAAVVDPAIGTAELGKRAVGPPTSPLEFLAGPALPGVRLARDIGSGLISAHQEAGQEFFEKAATEQNQLRNVERFLEAGVPLAGPAYRSLRKKVEQGDVAGAAGETLLNVAGARGATKPPVPGTSVVKTAARRVLDIGRKPQVAQSVVKEALSLPPKAIGATDKIVRALAPTGTNKGFRANAYVATKDLAEIAEKVDLHEVRGGIRNVDYRVRGFENAVNEHLATMEKVEHVPQIQRNANVPVSTKMSADAQEGLRYLSRSAGEEADRALAARMLEQKTVTVAEMDKIASVANKELLGFEALDASQKAAVAGINRRIGSLKQLDRTLADTLNTELRARGEIGLTSFQRRFAALSRLRDQAAIRKNAVELDVSLGKVTRPIISAVTGGKKGTVAGASQAAVADVNVGRMLEQGLRELRGMKLKADRGIPPEAVTMPTTTGAIGPHRPALPPARIEPTSGLPLHERILRAPQEAGKVVNEVREIRGVRWLWTGEQWLRMR